MGFVVLWFAVVIVGLMLEQATDVQPGLKN